MSKLVVNPGKVAVGSQKKVNLFITIEYANGRLSFSGVEGPQSNGNCAGGCGQIDMIMDNEYIDNIDFSYEWDREMFVTLLSHWKRWHLNDLNAGSQIQEWFLRQHENEYPGYPVSHYEWASNLLTENELNPDDTGYKYGSAWKFENVPNSVIGFLNTLPVTKITYPWKV